MTTDDLLKALVRLRVETGSLACLGCWHEHNCSTKGCRILREAAEWYALTNYGLSWLGRQLNVTIRTEKKGCKQNGKTDV